MDYKIHAWGWTPNVDRLDEWRDMIPGLGIIHYPATYHLARPGDVAYVNSSYSARRVASTPDLWKFAILGDERNVTGPSGHYESPSDYVARLGEANSILQDAGVKTSSAGLAMAGGHFDRDYQESLEHFGDYNGQNFRATRYERAMDGMVSMVDTKWLPTIIPMRLNWWPLKYNTLFAWLWQKLFTLDAEEQIRRLIGYRNTVGLGIWCLREGRLGDGHWQGWHGLIDRNDKLTWQGEAVKRVLAES